MTSTTLSYKSVLGLAISKGYNNETLAFTRKVWGDNAPSHEDIEQDETFCELALIHKWLMDEQHISIVIEPYHKNNGEILFRFTNYLLGWQNDGSFQIQCTSKGHPSYKQAMLAGISKALEIFS
jgi:hypothetical protein